MNMKAPVWNIRMTRVAFALGLASAGSAQAFTFEAGPIIGSFDSTLTMGTGVRVQSPACDLVINGATGSGAPSGCLAPTSGLGDQGNLNYEKGDAFTTYIKGTHELLLRFPDDWKFMGRVSWLRDFTATHTSGHVSSAPPVGSLASDAADDLKFKARLLDFWVSKQFDLNGHQARVRAGNQVISWGESLFLPGGINSTNAMDIMRLSQPGTQLKEVFLPAPIVSAASGLGGGVNVEGYVQADWNGNYFPPTGSYWSVVNGLGKGSNEYGFANVEPKKTGQYGISMRWQPAGTLMNLGLYAMNYHDKGPQLGIGAAGPEWQYPEDRKMYGVSVNLPVGDWAVGSELSYRPRDAVSLSPNVDGCANTGGKCYVDEKKWQWHLTGILSLTPGDYDGLLKALGGASTATLLAEAVVVKYPNMKSWYNGEPVSAGVWGWGQEFDPAAAVEPVGTRTSWGYNFDFSWTYDGSLIPGWQVTPEIYYFQAVKGRTPNAVGLFMEGAKSANFIVNFVQNPAKWQFAVNYARFWGGSRVFDQPYRDRDFVGAYVSRNF
jgi:hypothetical protein